jgi:hypothetical protein
MENISPEQVIKCLSSILAARKGAGLLQDSSFGVSGVSVATEQI